MRVDLIDPSTFPLISGLPFNGAFAMDLRSGIAFQPKYRSLGPSKVAAKSAK